MYGSRCMLMVAILGVVIGLSSCSLPSTGIAPTNTPPIPTLIPPTSTMPPTTEPTLPPTPVSINTPTALPDYSNLYLPVGIATLPEGGGRVVYYDLQGQQIGELLAPNLLSGSFQQAHIAGPLTYSPEPVLPPLVFYVFDNGGEMWLNANNNLTLIKAAPNLYTITGIAGKPLMAYSQVAYSDIGLQSLVFIGDPQTIANVNPALDSTNSQSYAVKPLAIATQNDQPVGVWYTTVPYGIGGDIIFEPTRTLSYLDLSTNQISTNLDFRNGPCGMSDDLAWIAYTPSGGSGPLSIVNNFNFETAITFPLMDGNDRGAGNGIFSPDNQFVAWKEASGSLMDQPPSFHETIRIATLDGIVLTEISDTSLVDSSGFTEVSWVVPIGWQDPQTLVLEVRGATWENVAILSIKYDGSGLTRLAPGSFIGFLYP